jgi:TRAP-type C4-dicarboxylate transport system permease small subunit
VTLDRIELALRSGLGVAVSILLSAIAVICFLEVILRYVFAASLSWYDELVGYLLVWLTFLGAVLAQSHGQHIGIGDLVEHAPARFRRVLELAKHMVLVAVHLVLLVFGAQLAMRFLGERAITVPVPMGVVYGVIPVSAALMLVMQAARIARLIRS